MFDPRCKCKCFNCGKEFITNDYNKMYCDECLSKFRVDTTSTPETTFSVFSESESKICSQNILLIEEGSVDINKLDELGIKYIVYRKDCQKPEVIKIWEKL